MIGTTLGALTDSSGRFEISSVPFGLRSLQVACPSYKQATIGNVLVQPDSTTELYVELEYQSIKLNSIETAEQPVPHRLIEVPPRHRVASPRISPRWVISFSWSYGQRIFPLRTRRWRIAPKSRRQDQFHLRPSPPEGWLYIVDGVSMRDIQGSTATARSGSERVATRPSR